jgi:hypothetical protein
MTDLDKSKFPLFSKLEETGLYKTHLPFPPEMREAISTDNWDKLDQLLFGYLSDNGYLRKVLDQFHHFSHTEHIIALRYGETDEDGIWHDDGSRHMAFTWSFNDDPNLEGGELLFKKKKADKIISIESPPSQTLVVFLTGEYGYEHKVNRVTKGVRKTIAGWCSTEPKA